MLFKNATIYTMEQEPFVGDFRIDKGVFTEIGKDLSPKDEEIQDLKRDVHTYKHKHDISCLENVTLHLKVAEQSKRISELKVETTMTKEDLEEDFKKRLGL